MFPKLLLHTCCAPCSIAIIDELRRTHDLTVFFYNPNIHPASEYAKRKAEVVRVCREWGVSMIDGDYETGVWDAEVGCLAQAKEGGRRCVACYRLRLEKTAAEAREQGFDLFASSLASGRQKKSAVVNAVGAVVGALSGVPFLADDWKKGGRLEKARTMVLERGIYKQTYCGCVYSLVKTSAPASAVPKPAGSAIMTPSGRPHAYADVRKKP